MRRIVNVFTSPSRRSFSHAVDVAARSLSGDCPTTLNIVSHAAQVADVATYTNLGALLYSPLGTAALVLLAYNVGVVGLRHLSVSLEFAARDYLQDYPLVHAYRYLVLVSLLLGFERMFIEV